MGNNINETHRLFILIIGFITTIMSLLYSTILSNKNLLEVIKQSFNLGNNPNPTFLIKIFLLIIFPLLIFILNISLSILWIYNLNLKIKYVSLFDIFMPLIVFTIFNSFIIIILTIPIFQNISQSIPETLIHITLIGITMSVFPIFYLIIYNIFSSNHKLYNLTLIGPNSLFKNINLLGNIHKKVSWKEILILLSGPIIFLLVHFIIFVLFSFPTLNNSTIDHRYFFNNVSIQYISFLVSLIIIIYLNVVGPVLRIFIN